MALGMDVALVLRARGGTNFLTQTSALPSCIIQIHLQLHIQFECRFRCKWSQPQSHADANSKFKLQNLKFKVVKI